IQLYYRKFHAYPPNLDALVKTNNIRFLRKKYIDPTTGKADWKPIMMCQNKTPMAMDFFGQPLGAASGCGVVGGMVPGGGAGLPGSPLQGGVGGNGSSGSIFNNSPTANGSIFSNPPAGSSPDGGTSGTGSGDQSGSGDSGGTDANGNPTSGQTFGGGGVIGVSPASTKKSLYVYKKKDHYNQWEFLYSPLQEMQQQMGTGLQGQPGTGIGQPGTGIGQPGSGFGSQNPGGFGPGGTTPIMPTPTPPPNQQ
ncbi:MAG: type II secretion system protein, partial [Terracidiphilus sp.]